jgi:serine protease Do
MNMYFGSIDYLNYFHNNLGEYRRKLSGAFSELKKFIIIPIFGLMISACNTTGLMVVPKTTPLDAISISTATKEQATFTLSKVVANIKRGTVIGHYPAAEIKNVGGTLCNHKHRGLSTITWGSGTSVLGNWSTELGEIFYETLSAEGLNIAGDPTDLFTRSEAAGSAEYLIGARITKISSNVCQEHDIWYGMPQNSFSGEMHITIEWSVFSNLLQRKILSLRTDGYHLVAQPKSDGLTLMFHNAFAQAAEGLLASSDFISIAKRNFDGTRMAVFSGDDLAIATLPEIKKNIKERLDAVLASIATVRAGQGHGSGFFISEDGLLLTNSHVVGDAKNISVLLNNGLEVPGEVIRKSDARDIALVKVNLRIPNALPIRSLIGQKLEKIFVVGTPIHEKFSSTITSGIISGVRGGRAGSFIQADAPVSPGNSGGPLLDDRGNVLGVSVAKIIATGSEGLSMFIPIHDALDALKIRLASSHTN